MLWRGSGVQLLPARFPWGVRLLHLEETILEGGRNTFTLLRLPDDQQVVLRQPMKLRVLVVRWAHAPATGQGVLPADQQTASAPADNTMKVPEGQLIVRQVAFVFQRGHRHGHELAEEAQGREHLHQDVEDRGVRGRHGEEAHLQSVAPEEDAPLAKLPVAQEHPVGTQVQDLADDPALEPARKGLAEAPVANSAYGDSASQARRVALDRVASGAPSRFVLGAWRG
mmetsp:Transcript_34172/g.106074  ORF Transcript_34172/g.106074 Transcript_34172/m.106074 type:complete len:226 (+) Transcript_34172:160-837(+)